MCQLIITKLHKSSFVQREHGLAIFIDHASGYIALRHQVSLSSTDTIKAKVDYERFAYHDGVYIQQYHTNNGVFNSKDFMKELMDSQQQVRFSGVGTGHMVLLNAVFRLWLMWHEPA